MECKYAYAPALFSDKQELIDTLWNVNITLYVDEYCCSGELIDTLWNVNENGYPELVAPPRINRYIMECKLVPNKTVFKVMLWN